MTPRLALLLALALASTFAGCLRGRGTLVIEVTSIDRLLAVDHFQILVDNGGQSADPINLPLQGTPPISIPPSRTFTLVFDPDRMGPTTVHIDAMDNSGHDAALASGAGEVSIAPGAQARLDITLQSTATVIVVDMGARDQAAAPTSDAAPPPSDAATVDLRTDDKSPSDESDARVLTDGAASLDADAPDLGSPGDR